MTAPEATAAGRRGPPRPVPANFLGDLIRARDVLQITDSMTSAAVADLLGLAGDGGDGGDQPEPPWAGHMPDPALRDTADPPVPVPSADPGIPVRHRGRGWGGRPAEEPVVPTRLSKWSEVTINGVAPGLPGWWDIEMAFPDAVGRRPEPAVPGGGRGAATTGGSDVPTLFRPRVARHILGAALSVPVAEGDIDVDSVADMVAARRPVATIPRKRLFTMRFGAQVLLDVGPGMQPFYTDVARLPEILSSIIGPGLTVLRFDTFPLDGAGPRGRPWPDYRPPPAGTPVLVVTSFGIGGRGAPRPAPVARWTAFVQLLNRAGCRPLALVPGSADRVDPDLSALMTVVPWDRAATVGTVRDLSWWTASE